MSAEYQVLATNPNAPFSLKLHRGDGMTLLAMNWTSGMPPIDFVGFAIEYREPGADRFWGVRNRLNFPAADGFVDVVAKTSLLAPIQKFRWVHFPRNADLPGAFTYRVTPVYMNSSGELSYGEAQQADIVLARETWPGQLNIAYTRGFVSSQAFADLFASKKGDIGKLLPGKGVDPLDFKPEHPNKDRALGWMGFEARRIIIEVLDRAIQDTAAAVSVVAFDLDDPEIVTRLEALGRRLRVIIDDSADHGKPESPESRAAKRLAATAGPDQVKRQRMGQLQHNKTIVVNSAIQAVALCGSTNFGWRGQFVQSNNLVAVYGQSAIQPFLTAFENYWNAEDAADFRRSPSTDWQSLQLSGIDAQVCFSPHRKARGVLKSVAEDILSAESSVLYSLAFLNILGGKVKDAITHVIQDPNIFTYGISDQKVGGLQVHLPNGKTAPVSAARLESNVPEPFRSEPAGGSGPRMHHKFLVIDFDKPTARVYTGSYNFSDAADSSNGENLLLLKDRRIAVSYMIQALSMFDHYHFRVVQQNSGRKGSKLQLQTPPLSGKQPWWDEYFANPVKVLDRSLFS